jgi:hypothetical protein
VVDVSKLRLAVGLRRGGEIVFEGAGGRVRVVVEYPNRSSELTHFYSLLTHANPETVIFYSGSTCLLRSLQLFQAESPATKYLHSDPASKPSTS